MQPPPNRDEESDLMSMMKLEEPRANGGPGRLTPPPSPHGGASDLLLGEGAEFEGRLKFRGTVRIDALFKGSIITNDVLVVGEHARIDAEITCGTVVVHGAVNGNISASSGVELLRTARVRGNVKTPSLRLEKGAVLDGDVKMGS